MKIPGLHFCSFDPFEDNIRFRQHNNPFISYTIPIDGTSLIAYWQFNETSGNLINNANLVTGNSTLGTAADGINTGVTQNQSGIISNSYLYAGTSSSYTTIGSSVSQFNFLHQSGNKWSCAFWYKQVTYTGDSRIFSTDKDSSTVGVYLNIGASHILSYANPQAGSSADSSANFITNDSNWHFYVITYDATLGSNNTSFYRDGSLISNAGVIGYTAGNANNAMVLAARGVDHTSANNGYFDEMSLWTRILTSTEITLLYNGGSGRTLY